MRCIPPASTRRGQFTYEASPDRRRLVEATKIEPNRIARQRPKHSDQACDSVFDNQPKTNLLRLRPCPTDGSSISLTSPLNRVAASKGRNTGAQRRSVAPVTEAAARTQIGRGVSFAAVQVCCQQRRRRLDTASENTIQWCITNAAKPAARCPRAVPRAERC